MDNMKDKGFKQKFYFYSGVMLQFQHPVYSMLESETIIVCIVANEDIQRPMYVNIAPFPSGKNNLLFYILNALV